MQDRPGSWPQTRTETVNRTVSFLFFFSLSPLKEASGSSKISLSKFLLSDSSCDKHGEMLRNTTPRKPKGQQRRWLILLGEEHTPEPG